MLSYSASLRQLAFLSLLLNLMLSLSLSLFVCVCVCVCVCAGCLCVCMCVCPPMLFTSIFPSLPLCQTAELYLDHIHPLSHLPVSLSVGLSVFYFLAFLSVCLSVYQPTGTRMLSLTCLNDNIYSYLETSGGQSYDLYLNVVYFFNTSVN